MKLERAILFLRISLGICFLWFGMLKFFSGMSPAEQLAIKTMDVLTFGLIPSVIEIKLLALWEVVVGIGFLLGKQIKWVLGLFFLHMTLTFFPLVMFPEICFTHAPFVFSLVGQYIVKNVVLIMGGVIIYSVNAKVRQ